MRIRQKALLITYQGRIGLKESKLTVESLYSAICSGLLGC